MPACQRAKSVPASHFYFPTCHTVIVLSWRANFSTWRTNVPKAVPIFQLLVLPNAKESFYTLLHFT